jgi:hypothetical protein
MAFQTRRAEIADAVLEINNVRRCGSAQTVSREGGSSFGIAGTSHL